VNKDLSFSSERVSNSSRTFSWKVRTVGPWTDLEDTTNPFWVTWGEPNFGASVGVTAKRVNFATGAARPGSTVELIATFVYWSVAEPNNPPQEPSPGSINTDTWYLLDGRPFSGQCDEQARFMGRVLKMLGVGSSTALVRASTDSGEGNCLDPEYRWCPLHGSGEFLCLDFYGGGQSGNMNQFEGCCVAGGHYYALWPREMVTNDYTMLQALSCQQYWVETNGPAPGEEGWKVETVWSEEEKP